MLSELAAIVEGDGMAAAPGQQAESAADDLLDRVRAEAVDLRQDGIPGLSLDQADDRTTATRTHDGVSFPVADPLAPLDDRGAIRDGDRRGPRGPHFDFHAKTPQKGVKLASMIVVGKPLVNSLRRDSAVRLIRKVMPHAASDLVRGPILPQMLLDIPPNLRPFQLALPSLVLSLLA
jgi:hypothetical protein